jgi:transposase
VLAGRRVHVSVSAIWCFFAKEKISFKKSLLPSEQERPDVALKRTDWLVRQPLLDIRRLVFLDETWAKTNMTRIHGRCRKGQRLRGKAPYGHWKTMTFVAGLRLDGIIAPMVLDCPMNGDIFASYAAQALARKLRPGGMLIMDNLGSHKPQQARKAIGACGAQILFLPPYSPDMNPIEQLFSKIKILLRKAAKRSVEDVWMHIGKIIDAISPMECENYIRNLGYA